jgi:diacylglycerol kinase
MTPSDADDRRTRPEAGTTLDPRPGPPGDRGPAASGAIDLALEERLAEWGTPPAWAARAGLRTTREKFAAGLRGVKHAVRGDSSFFAHAYRGLLIAMTAAMLGIDPRGWCLLALAAALVLIAELALSAVDTLARALGDAEAPGPKMAREIATGGVLVAVVVAAAVAVTVLATKLGDLLGWWS